MKAVLLQIRDDVSDREAARRAAKDLDWKRALRLEPEDVPFHHTTLSFSRIVFNVCVGNTDDHARNHAALWDGERLTLTLAYDICPQPRAGGEAAQAMAIGRDGRRLSRLATCLDAASVYQLDATEAHGIIERIVEAVQGGWEEAADAARLTGAERAQKEGRQILNPYALEGYTGRPARRSASR